MKKSLFFILTLIAVCFTGIAGVSAAPDNKWTQIDFSGFFANEDEELICDLEDQFCLSNLGPDAAPQAIKPGSLVSFQATDITGKPVSSLDIFSKQKVTMLKIWSVTCAQCIRELPELSRLNKEFQSQGARIIGIVYDADNEEYVQEAKEILEMLDVDFTNLLPNPLIQRIFQTQAFPATLFINNKGILLDDPVLGAKTGMYPELVSKYLTQSED